MEFKYIQDEAKYRVNLKREIRRLLGINLYEGIRDLSTEKLEDIRNNLIKNMKGGQNGIKCK